MQIHDLELPGVKLIELKTHVDQRGFFVETWKASWKISDTFAQDNHSWSAEGTLRGLHCQEGMGKYVRCVSGVIFDVALDPRTGQYLGVPLDRDHALYVPAGYAHGFLALTEANVVYKCTTEYDQSKEWGIRWDSAGIDWPMTPKIISEKDKNLPMFRGPVA